MCVWVWVGGVHFSSFLGFCFRFCSVFLVGEGGAGYERRRLEAGGQRNPQNPKSWSFWQLPGPD